MFKYFKAKQGGKAHKILQISIKYNIMIIKKHNCSIYYKYLKQQKILYHFSMAFFYQFCADKKKPPEKTESFLSFLFLN
jgi:hypothetical protein